MILSLREKLTGIIAIAIIILLAIPLAFVGVESLFLNSNRISNIGSVNGQDISEHDYGLALAVRESRVQELLGENYSPELFDNTQLESAALTGLVDLYLYVTHGKDNDLGVTESYVVRQIQQMPQFQVNGQFSDILFSNYLAQLGYTSTTFIETFGDELVYNILSGALQTSAIATEQMLEKNVAVSQEKRSYQTLLLPVESVLDDVEVTEQEITDYHSANDDLFMHPERVSLDYVQLSVTDFVDDVEVSAAEVGQRFELVRASLPSRRQAAHILVEVEDNDAHLTVLDEIQVKLEEGVDFAELAAEYSDDIGSSGSGGLLGYSDGASFPAEFEAELIQLEVGEVSGPVLTDAGVHIIKLMNVDQAEFNLEDQYSSLEQELLLEKAGDIYRQNLERLRDAAFSTDNLEQLIADFSEVKMLEPRSTGLFEQQSGEGIAANVTVRAIAFSDVVLEERLNSEVVELDETEAVVVHLNQRVAPGVAPLNEVRDQILATLTKNKGSALLEGRVEEIQARLNAGEEPEDVARSEEIEWQVQLDAVRGTGGALGQAVFAAPITGEFPIVGAQIQANGDYLVYSIDEMSSGSLDDFNSTQVSQLAFQMSQLVANGESRAYLDTLRSNADIDLKIDVEIE